MFLGPSILGRRGAVLVVEQRQCCSTELFVETCPQSWKCFWTPDWNFCKALCHIRFLKATSAVCGRYCRSIYMHFNVYNVIMRNFSKQQSLISLHSKSINRDPQMLWYLWECLHQEYSNFCWEIKNNVHRIPFLQNLLHIRNLIKHLFTVNIFQSELCPKPYWITWRQYYFLLLFCLNTNKYIIRWLNK